MKLCGDVVVIQHRAAMRERAKITSVFLARAIDNPKRRKQLNAAQIEKILNIAFYLETK